MADKLTDMERRAQMQAQGLDEGAADLSDKPHIAPPTRASIAPSVQENAQELGEAVMVPRPEPDSADGPTPKASVRKLDLDALDDVVEQIERGSSGSSVDASSKPQTEDSYDTEATNSRCINCGFDRYDSILDEPNDEDKAEFVRSILGERPFEKAYEIFDGAATVFFRTLTHEQDTILNDTIMSRIQSARYQTPDESQAAYMRLRLLLTLSKLERAKGTTLKVPSAEELLATYGEKASTSDDAFDVADREILGRLPEALIKIFMMDIRKFDSVVQQLSSRANDADFWGGPTDS